MKARCQGLHVCRSTTPGSMTSDRVHVTLTSDSQQLLVHHLSTAGICPSQNRGYCESQLGKAQLQPHCNLHDRLHCYPAAMLLLPTSHSLHASTPSAKALPLASVSVKCLPAWLRVPLLHISSQASVPRQVAAGLSSSVPLRKTSHSGPQLALSSPHGCPQVGARKRG